jgi:hypothetical protein
MTREALEGGFNAYVDEPVKERNTATDSAGPMYDSGDGGAGPMYDTGDGGAGPMYDVGENDNAGSAEGGKGPAYTDIPVFRAASRVHITHPSASSENLKPQPAAIGLAMRKDTLADIDVSIFSDPCNPTEQQGYLQVAIGKDQV